MMSSAITQRGPSTPPITFITSAVHVLRRLSMMASSASSRLAKARARSAPPASGETIVTGPAPARQVVDDDRRGEQVIDRDVEEPLDLRLVQVHRQHAIGAGGRSRFATSLAEIGTRGLSLRSWRA